MRVLSQVVHTKDVNFFGVTLTIPDCVDYLACDKNGTVWGYEELSPNISHRHGKWFAQDVEDYDYYEIAHVDLEGLDWTQTLIEV